MRNSIKSLLEEVGKDTSRSRKMDDHISGVIGGFMQQFPEQEIFLTSQIRNIRKYVKEILISLPKDYEIQDVSLKNEVMGSGVKIVERDEEVSPYSTKVFVQLINKSLNNRVLYVPFDFDISKIKLENLINHSFPLVSYLGILGNYFPFIGLVDKWKNRFNLQLIRFFEDANLDDFYRNSSNLTFFKLIRQDSISRKNLVSTNMLKSIQSQEIDTFFPLKIQYPSDEQAMVKLIALMHILQKEIEEKNEIASSFKVQQLLTLSNRFTNFGHNYLAFQAYRFLLLRSEKTIRFPLDWSLAEITDQARRSLLEESKIYAERGLERMRMMSLNNLITLNLAKDNDREWILSELPKIKESLQKDNIEYCIEN